MAAPTRIIDSHQHVFWHGHDDRGLIADMDDHGIEYAWLLSWEVPPWENNTDYHHSLNPVNARVDGTHAGIPLRDILLARDRHPHRFVAGYCPHPALPSAPHLLRAAAEIHDVRVCGEWKFRILFDDPRCLELYRAAGELNLPVVLHLDVPYLPAAEGNPTYQPNWYGGTVDNLERALEACPDTNFVGHAPGFWREISDSAPTDTEIYPKTPLNGPGKLHSMFERFPNLYADLSAGSGMYALSRDPEHAVQFLTRFADRILFGRDFYRQELHQFLQSLDLPDEVWRKIYFENAERLVSPPGK